MPKKDDDLKKVMEYIDFNSKEIGYVNDVQYKNSHLSGEDAKQQINDMTDDEFLAMVL